MCFFCRMADSVYHTFVKFPVSKLFYGQVIKWLNVENASSFFPSPCETLFRMLSSSPVLDANARKPNYSLMFAKYYIYCQRLSYKALNFNEFKQRCFYGYGIEAFVQESVLHIKWFSLLLT